MVIENKKTTIVFHLRRLLFIVLVVIAVVLLLYIDFFDKETLGFGQEYLIYALILMYLLYYSWGMIRDYHYIYYSDFGPSKLIFRFYSLVPLSKKQNSIEIRKDELYDYQFMNKAFGFRRYLLLYQKTNKGIAKYPPISISMLTKSQRKDLSVSLSTYTIKKTIPYSQT